MGRGRGITSVSVIHDDTRLCHFDIIGSKSHLLVSSLGREKSFQFFLGGEAKGANHRVRRMGQKYFKLGERDAEPY